MDISREHREEIERELLRIIISALERKKINLEDHKEISLFIVDRLNKVHKHGELIDFLIQLSERWVVFSGLLTTEKGKMKEVEDKNKSSEISRLIKENKIDQALLVVNKTLDHN